MRDRFSMPVEDDVSSLQVFVAELEAKVDSLSEKVNEFGWRIKELESRAGYHFSEIKARAQDEK